VNPSNPSADGVDSRKNQGAVCSVSARSLRDLANRGGNKFNFVGQVLFAAQATRLI